MTLAPLKFQRDAVENLTEVFVKLWKKTERKLPIVLKSPTGSGKTFITALLIRGLNHLPQWSEDKAFIWITFSDEIAMQSKEKFGRYFENNLENNTLTVQDINRGKLYANDILFLNWQKVVQDNATTRRLKLRRPDKEDERKESGKYFEDFIEGTKEEGREIVLVIDEAHKNVDTELAQHIVSMIDPKIVLHVSATPADGIVAEAAEHNSFVKVDREEVVAEGLIKESIVLQSEEDLKKMGGKDLDEVLLQLGIDKRETLVKEYKKLDKNVNPLVLIQLPNDDTRLVEAGERTKEEVVMSFLVKQGVKEHKIARWFDGKKENMEGITDNESDVDFMLFKQAAGTGWDCPRASILVMFREITSNTFYKQTVGRILRMPEPQLRDDYKSSPLLRRGYLFTNYRRNQVQIPDQNDNNKAQTQSAHIRSGVQNISLQSDYIPRVDYGDIPRSYKFQESFRKSFDEHFGLAKGDILGKAQEKLKSKKLDLDGTLLNAIVADAEFSDFDQLAFEFVKKGNDVSLEMSVSDIEKTFNYLCYQLLQEQEDEQAKYANIARSWSVLKSAIRIWFKGVLGEDSSYYYRVFIKDIQKGAESVFRPAITKALRDFKPIAQKLIADRKKEVEERESPVFTVQSEYQYTDDYREVPQKLCVLDTFYLLSSYTGRDNEMNFIKYLEQKKGKIEWWFKNGNQGKDYFAVRYINSETGKEELFYPDWIVLFKDGRIGIFDTKKGRTATDADTADKARALQAKIKEFGKKYLGGIAIEEAGVWYCNDSSEYTFKGGQSVNDSKGWKPFETLFNYV
ncbi:DEAD/DEAH box helicase family protein [Candidatus Kaiserbacteria bacterium]|nr:DEAD/DEAH box helicase family protein [Candidatus Kaiserbacteria bacterium]